MSSFQARGRCVGLALGLALLGAVGCSSGPEGDEGSASDVVSKSFDKNNVLDDASLVAADTMTQEEVQSFLEKTPYGTRAGLADYTTGGQRASEWIHQAAVDNGINPVAMLVRLQMEKGLISAKDAPDFKVDAAFGCGCESAKACSDKYLGLDKQATCMARTLRRDMDGLARGKATVSGWKLGVAKKTEDGITVTPATYATAALYTYTPWVGEAGGGKAGIGGASLHWAVWKKFGGVATTPSSHPDEPKNPPSSTRGCTSSASCSATTPVCDVVSGKCVGCQADYADQNAAPLSCPTAAKPACQVAGSSAGACVECTGENTSACDGQHDRPACVEAASACGCTEDGDCDEGEYCDAKNGAAGLCATGCRVQGGADTCPEGQACSKHDGTVGTCAGEGCETTGCSTAPNLVCDTQAATPSCVQCLKDADCGDTKVCDTKAKKCVECTGANKQACSAKGSGAACLAANVCGCVADSDCGSATSGRVCDPSTHACRVGCRDSGGNRCPSGQICSTDNGIGTCSMEKTGTGSGSGSGSGSSSDSDSEPEWSGRPPHAPSTGSGGGSSAPAAEEPSDGPAPAKKGCAVSGVSGRAGAGELVGLCFAMGVLAQRRRRRVTRTPGSQVLAR